MPHAFISYVRENAPLVDQLYQALTAAGVEVWLDRNDIPPGARFRTEIRRAIRSGSFFIACFSAEYNDRDRTDMNEELTLAIEEIRRHPHDRLWFIPVKLNECEIPDRDIGGGVTLQDLNYVDLDMDWNGGIQRILSVIRPRSTAHGSTTAPPPQGSSRPISRLELIRALNALPSQQLNELIFELSPPAGIVPPPSAAQGDRVFALVNWAEGTGGCSLPRVQEVLNTIINPR